jgi:hypothetical protein
MAFIIDVSTIISLIISAIVNKVKCGSTRLPIASNFNVASMHNDVHRVNRADELYFLES